MLQEYISIGPWKFFNYFPYVNTEQKFNTYFILQFKKKSVLET